MAFHRDDVISYRNELPNAVKAAMHQWDAPIEVSDCPYVTHHRT